MSTSVDIHLCFLECNRAMGDKKVCHIPLSCMLCSSRPVLACRLRMQRGSTASTTRKPAKQRTTWWTIPSSCTWWTPRAPSSRSTAKTSPLSSSQSLLLTMSGLGSDCIPSHPRPALMGVLCSKRFLFLILWSSSLGSCLHSVVVVGLHCQYCLSFRDR